MAGSTDDQAPEVVRPGEGGQVVEEGKILYIPPDAEYSGYTPPRAWLRRRGCKLIDWLLLIAIAIIALVVGGVIGGVIGKKWPRPARAMLGNIFPRIQLTQHSTMCSMFMYPNSTLLSNYSVAIPAEVNTLALDCPAITGSQYTTVQNQVFTSFCFTDFQGGLIGASGYEIADIINFPAYNYTDCIEACSDFNARSAVWHRNMTCKGLYFGINLRNATLSSGGNCWLKNDTSTSGQGVTDPMGLSAQLDN
jgi:hypothetical protein